MNATAKLIEQDGRNWYELNGTDSGTGHVFTSDVYGVADDGQILNSEGYPLTEGDYETIAVRNAIAV